MKIGRRLGRVARDIENYAHPGISRDFIVQGAGLVGFKRILYSTKTTDPKKLKSILKHLQINVEKAPKDLDYIKKMKNVAN